MLNNEYNFQGGEILGVLSIVSLNIFIVVSEIENKACWVSVDLHTVGAWLSFICLKVSAGSWVISAAED